MNTSGDRRLFLLQALLITVLTVLVYVHAPQARGLMMDDSSLNFDNPLVTQMSKQSIKGIFTTYDPELYIPMTLLSYKAEHALWGESLTLTHITNMILHILNAVLVLLLIRELTRETWISFLTALLFAVHPLQTEAVMWIAARKDLLSAFFFLMTLLAYRHYAKTGKRLSYFASIFLFACALMSKVLTIMLPLILMITDDVRPPEKKHGHAMRLAPYWILSMLFLMIGVARKVLTVDQMSYATTMLVAGKSITFYLQKLLLPVDLMLFYHQHTPVNALSWEFALPMMVLPLLYVIAFAAHRASKWISFGILWFFMTLLPNLANFTRLDTSTILFASDRYVYLASIGIFLLISMGVITLYRQKFLLAKVISLTLALSTISMCAVFTYRQSLFWQSPRTLMMHMITIDPDAHMALTILGVGELNDGHITEAVTHLRTASALAPDFETPHTHLALALLKQGNSAEAIRTLNDVLQKSPTSTYGLSFLAFALQQEGRLLEAQKTVDLLLTLHPDSPQGFQILGSIEEQRRHFDKAQEHYLQAIKLDAYIVSSKAALARLMRERSTR